MAQKGRVPVNEAEDLSWSPKAHRVEQRNDFLSCSLMYIFTVWSRHVYACTHAHTINT